MPTLYQILSAFIRLTADSRGLFSEPYSKIRHFLMKVVRPKFKGLCSADIYPLVPIQKYITRDSLFRLLLISDFTEYAINGSARAGMPKVNCESLYPFTTHYSIK